MLNVLMDTRKLNNKPLVNAEKHGDKYHGTPPPKDKDLEVSGISGSRWGSGTEQMNTVLEHLLPSEHGHDAVIALP